MKNYFWFCVVASIFALRSPANSEGTMAKQPESKTLGTSNIQMPEGFSNVYLGMALKDFLKQRPHAQYSHPFDWGKKIDPSGSPTLVDLDEKVNNPYFTAANFYSFENGKLANVHWLNFYLERDLEPKTREYLRYIVRLYGAPTLLKIASDGSGKLKPELIWQKGKVLIIASFTPEARFYRPDAKAPREDRGYVSLSIKMGHVTDLKEDRRVLRVTRSDVEKYLVPVQQEIARLSPNQKTPVPIEVEYLVPIKSLKSNAAYLFRPSEADSSSLALIEESQRTIFVIRDADDLGSATLSLIDGQWPKHIVLRFQHDSNRGFKSLHWLELATARIKVNMRNVTSGSIPFYFFDGNGETQKPAGALNISVQKRASGFDVALPDNLFIGSSEIEFGWIESSGMEKF